MDECQGRKVEQAGEIKIMQNEKLFFLILAKTAKMLSPGTYMRIDHFFFLFLVRCIQFLLGSMSV